MDPGTLPGGKSVGAPRQGLDRDAPCRGSPWEPHGRCKMGTLPDEEVRGSPAAGRRVMVVHGGLKGGTCCLHVVYPVHPLSCWRVLVLRPPALGGGSRVQAPWAASPPVAGRRRVGRGRDLSCRALHVQLK